jgi:predicted lipid-binding transport protein (Tim44 family)
MIYYWEMDSSTEQQKRLSKLDEEIKAVTHSAFLVIKNGWNNGKVEPLRHVMTDSLWAIEKDKMDSYRRERVQKIISGVMLGNVKIRNREQVEQTQYVTVRLDVSGKEYDVDIRTGQALNSDIYVPQWCEDWKFERDLSILGQNWKCSNCGAPVPETPDDGLCKFCQEPLSGLKSDWLVSEMNKVDFEAFRNSEPATLSDIPTVGIAPEKSEGLKAIIAGDPDFNIRAFQAEARIVFYALEKARAIRRTDEMAIFASPELQEQETKAIQSAVASGRVTMKGGLEITDVSVGEIKREEGKDFIEVKISCSSLNRVVNPTNEDIIEHPEGIIMWHETLLFARPISGKTLPLDEIMPESCPNCGTTVDALAGAKCVKCGFFLGRREDDWRLINIVRDKEGA